jgi:hypothetical protein
MVLPDRFDPADHLLIHGGALSWMVTCGANTTVGQIPPPWAVFVLPF